MIYWSFTSDISVARETLSWMLSPNMIQYFVSINMDIDAKSVQIDSTTNPTLPHSSLLAATLSCFFDFSAEYAVFMWGYTSLYILILEIIMSVHTETILIVKSLSAFLSDSSLTDPCFGVDFDLSNNFFCKTLHPLFECAKHLEACHSWRFITCHRQCNPLSKRGECMSCAQDCLAEGHSCTYTDGSGKSAWLQCTIGL